MYMNACIVSGPIKPLLALPRPRPIYARTSAYGHFGRAPEPDGGLDADAQIGKRVGGADPKIIYPLKSCLPEHSDRKLPKRGNLYTPAIDLPFESLGDQCARQCPSEVGSYADYLSITAGYPQLNEFQQRSVARKQDDDTSQGESTIGHRYKEPRKNIGGNMFKLVRENVGVRPVFAWYDGYNRNAKYQGIRQ
jgi:hypothetical protein